MILPARGGGTVAELLAAARGRTLALVSGLAPDRLLGPQLRIVNPPLWEVGHIGWFQEHWCLRYRRDAAPAPSLLANADALYDSAAVAHDTRWTLTLPTFAATLDYLDRVYERVLERVGRLGEDADLRYFAQLAALHEEMHAEAFTYSRQTLGWPPPFGMAEPHGHEGACPGDVVVDGGTFLLGSRQDGAFVFDNEKWAHEVRVAPFRIARAPVTNAEYAAFVEDGSYRSRAWWSEEGWRWREEAQATAPVYWRRAGDAWTKRVFDEQQPLRPHAPVMHVNWYEADAYCRWAGRRLPTEAEWEFAAATVPGDAGRKRRYPWGDEAWQPHRANLYRAGVSSRADVAAYAAGDSAWGCRQMLGNVWEWTADAFKPYPGFSPDPYKEYSAPWFGDHKVLRGGCHATRPAVVDNMYRNFYTPDRRDAFAGFRTCALP